MERVRGREGGDQREGEGEGECKREAWREGESDCEGGEGGRGIRARMLSLVRRARCVWGGREILARMLSLVLQKWRIQRKKT